ncbi:MAG: hemerythrin domain-containing protein [Pirellulales bacterium]|jgi:iron-sulfur cluster repair protein YtfE (RIC family)|nr:hemerythrin domain-containing protein [Thermoguttaceae bacterium]MDD4786072.1 hemerythrin domain-containing protein [Pirellulales bacterium]MDI9444236.1 hemerythrin domain-containing protein [Planctomycetota bacterium]NLZ02852.1 hypothetical protein [Pirellulaceae bacterium]
MSPDPSELTFHKIQEQHRRLADLLKRIETLLERRSGPPQEVVQLLGQLGDQLVKHFETEETGGYFTEALLHAPQLVARANALMLQHPKMTQRSRELGGAADPETSPEAWWEQTRERFAAFRAELHEHERAEDGLIQEVYMRDIGSHD